MTTTPETPLARVQREAHRLAELCETIAKGDRYPGWEKAVARARTLSTTHAEHTYALTADETPFVPTSEILATEETLSIPTLMFVCDDDSMRARDDDNTPPPRPQITIATTPGAPIPEPILRRMILDGPPGGRASRA